MSRITEAGSISIEVVDGGYIVTLNSRHGGCAGRVVRERLEGALLVVENYMRHLTEQIGQFEGVPRVSTDLHSNRTDDTGITMDYGGGRA